MKTLLVTFGIILELQKNFVLLLLFRKSIELIVCFICVTLKPLNKYLKRKIYIFLVILRLSSFNTYNP